MAHSSVAVASKPRPGAATPPAPRQPPTQPKPPAASTPAPIPNPPAASTPAPTPTPPAPALHTPQGGGGCATPDLAEDRLWTRSGPGWTGADGTYSVGLPDSRSLWMFGDTFLGALGADGSRPRTSPFIHNSLVAQRGSVLSDIYRTGPGGVPSAAVSPADATALYWPGAGVVEGAALRWFVLGFHVPSAWNFTFTGSAIVTLSLPGLGVTSVTPVPAAAGVEWGAWVLQDGGFTYIYGIENGGYLHIARAPGGHVLGPWQYYSAGTWSSDPSASSRVLDGLSNQFSVVRVAGRYELISQNPGFSRNISAYAAPTPVGPFGAPRVIYTTPSWGAATYTYNAVAHPEQPGAGLLVSYNVNSLTSSDVYADASLYRPRFVRVPAACFQG